MFARGTAADEREKEMSNSKRKNSAPDNGKSIASGVETSSFFQGAKDIMGKLERHVITMFFASIIASVAIFLFYDFNFPVEIITQKCYDYCPMLIAFAIAIYAFFLSIEKREVKKRAEEQIGRGYTVASVFSATIIWFAFNTLVLLVLAALSEIAQGESKLFNILVTSYIIYVIFLLVDLLEVMYGFHTFIYPEEKDIADLIGREKEARTKKTKKQRIIGLIYLLLSPFLIATLISVAIKGDIKSIILVKYDFSYVEILTVSISYLVYSFIIIVMIRKKKEAK